MKGIQIIEYSEIYRKSAIDLLKRAFPGSKHDEAFSWRFDTSEKYKPIIVCAIEGNNVISFNSWIKWIFKLEDKTFVGYQSGDSATHDNYLRRGIWQKTLRLGEEIAEKRGYIDFFFGFPAEMSFGGFMKTGYVHVGTYNKNIRIVNPLLFPPRRGNENKTQGTEVPTFLSQRNVVSPIVDSEYTDWRYSQSPKEAKIINYFEHGEAARFVLREGVYHNKRFGIKVPEIEMLDSRFTSYSKQFVTNSVRFLERTFSRKALWIRTFFNEGTERGDALKAQFPIKARKRGGKLIFKKISQAVDGAFWQRFVNWDLQPHVVDSE